MPPKGYETPSIPKALMVRLRRMKKAQGFKSIWECIEYLMRFTVW